MRVLVRVPVIVRRRMQPNLGRERDLLSAAIGGLDDQHHRDMIAELERPAHAAENDAVRPWA
jgi:hypothetical protein